MKLKGRVPNRPNKAPHTHSCFVFHNRSVHRTLFYYCRKCDQHFRFINLIGLFIYTRVHD